MYLRREGALLLSLMLVAAAPLPASMPGPGRSASPATGAESGERAVEPLYVMACLEALLVDDTPAVETLCGKALSLNPNDADAYKLRGYGYLIDHRFQRAEMDFRHGLVLRKKDGEMLAGLGQSLSGQGHFKDAIQQLSQATRLASAKAAYWDALCWAQAGEGHALGAALKNCNQALALEPGAAVALNSRGLVKLKSRHFATAIIDYDASLVARPQQSSARFGRGLAKLWIGDGAGSADIATARSDDAGIDALFVLIGVLPTDCSHPGPRACPPGFPARSQKAPDYRLRTVSFVHEDDEDILLGIEVGRLDLMVEQIALLLDRPRQTHHAEVAPQSPAEAMGRLAATAERFNTLLPAACYCAHIPKKHCTPYRLRQEGETLHGAFAAAGDLFRHIYPVWQAACRGHKSQCQLE